MKIKNFVSRMMGVNCYLVSCEETSKAVIIDPGEYDPAITAAINEECLDVTYIILTHGHGDHIGGVEGLKKDFPQLQVLAAKAEAPLLRDARTNMSAMMGMYVEIIPDVTVEEGDTLDVGNMHMKFVMTPGHTPGGMCIIIDGVVFSGDTLFQMSIGRTDFPGGSFDELIRSIKNKLFVLPDETKVYPGHMGETSIGFEKENNPFCLG